MPYIERHSDGRIKGVYAQLQPGYAEEWSEQDYDFDDKGNAVPREPLAVADAVSLKG